MIKLAKIYAKEIFYIKNLLFENNDKVFLGHEYQFYIDDESGKLALERMEMFLNNLD